MPPDRYAIQRPPTALTTKAGGTLSAARTIPWIHWGELLGVSRNR
jgi:hypothetical protein